MTNENARLLPCAAEDIPPRSRRRPRLTTIIAGGSTQRDVRPLRASAGTSVLAGFAFVPLSLPLTFSSPVPSPRRAASSHDRCRPRPCGIESLETRAIRDTHMGSYLFSGLGDLQTATLRSREAGRGPSASPEARGPRRADGRASRPPTALPRRGPASAVVEGAVLRERRAQGRRLLRFREWPAARGSPRSAPAPRCCEPRWKLGLARAAARRARSGLRSPRPRKTLVHGSVTISPLSRMDGASIEALTALKWALVGEGGPKGEMGGPRERCRPRAACRWLRSSARRVRTRFASCALEGRASRFGRLLVAGASFGAF